MDTFGGSSASSETSQLQDGFSLVGRLWSLISVASCVSVCSKCVLVHHSVSDDLHFLKFSSTSALVVRGYCQCQFGSIASQTWLMAWRMLCPGLHDGPVLSNFNLVSGLPPRVFVLDDGYRGSVCKPVSWKRGLLANGVGEASHPGPAATSADSGSTVGYSGEAALQETHQPVSQVSRDQVPYLTESVSRAVVPSPSPPPGPLLPLSAVQLPRTQPWLRAPSDWPPPLVGGTVLSQVAWITVLILLEAGPLVR